MIARRSLGVVIVVVVVLVVIVTASAAILRVSSSKGSIIHLLSADTAWIYSKSIRSHWEESGHLIVVAERIAVIK